MRTLGLTAAFLVSAALTGCESLGFSTPVNPLLKDAKAMRTQAPVTVPVPRELSKELLAAYIVEPGDTLLVQPVEFDAPVRFPPDQPVFPDGTIDLGLYGRPVVAGKTLAEIEPQVQELVNAKEKQRAAGAKPVPIAVRLIGRVSKVYYVLGDVNVPNSYPITGRETVLDAIVQAGGLTRRAARDQIVLSRPTSPEGCRVLYPVCYDQIVQLGDTTTNYQLQPGDRVFVPSQGFVESLLPFLIKTKSGPCCRPQVSCFAEGCPAPANGCVPVKDPMPGTTGTHGLTLPQGDANPGNP